MASLLLTFLVACTPSGGLEGALPDGTRYVVRGIDPAEESFPDIFAVILVDLPDGSAAALGTTLGSWNDGEEEGVPNWAGDHLRVPTGGR